jgi:hypothetical protein
MASPLGRLIPLQSIDSDTTPDQRDRIRAGSGFRHEPGVNLLSKKDFSG